MSDPKSSDTLFGTINRTKTKSGYMLLRTSILQVGLSIFTMIKNKNFSNDCIQFHHFNFSKWQSEQPSTDLDLITKRFNMIDAILSSIENFNSFENLLMNYSSVDLDQLLVNLVQLPSYSGTRFLRLAEKKIDYIIQMKHAVSLVDQLRSTLENCEPNLFANYIEMLKDKDFDAIKDMIDEVINSNTKCIKGGGGANMKLEKCFAIKDRYNPLLDLARSIYSETIDDIIALVQAYGN